VEKGVGGRNEKVVHHLRRNENAKKKLSGGGQGGRPEGGPESKKE